MLVKCRHVVIPTLPLRNVLFWKAIFTRHPDLLKRVLGEFARIRLRFVLHRVFAGEGSGRDRNTGSFPVVLPWRWPVFHQRCSARMEITKDPVVSLSLLSLSLPLSRGITCFCQATQPDRNDQSSGATQLLLNRKSTKSSARTFSNL